MRGRWLQRARNDEGMTLVEIVVASVIMFFILTAVLALVAQTTSMSVQAKRKAMLTNAVASYVERVQALPFAQVGVVSVDASGTLEPEYVQNEGDFTVAIRPAVAPGANSDLKTLHLDVTLADARGVSETFSTDVTIRNRSQYLVQASRNPATDPIIRFTAPTPADETVVYDDVWLEGTALRSLSFGVYAESYTDRTIENVQMWCDDQWLLQDGLGNRAQWNVNARTWSTSSFRWNTRQTEDVVQADGTIVPTEIIPDGVRTISVYALDSMGVSVYTVRHLLVDNDPPATPGPPTPTVKTATATDLSWTQSMDGTTPADRYRLWIWRVKTPAEWALDPSYAWKQVVLSDPEPRQPAYALTTIPFARYWVAVAAYSPRNLVSGYAVIPQHFTSRPRLNGTYAVIERKDGVNRYFKTKVDLSVTPPNVATHEAPSYTWYWQYDDGTGGSATTASSTHTIVTLESLGAARPVHAWVTVTFKPVDRSQLQAPVTTTSNIVGPTPLTGSGTLGEGTW